MEPNVIACKGYFIRPMLGFWYVFDAEDKTKPNEALFSCEKVGNAKLKITKREKEAAN